MLKKLTTCYLLFLVVVVVSADLGLLASFSGWLHHVPFGDKACHFVFVGLLSFLASLTLSNQLGTKKKRTVVLLTIVSLVVLTSLEELSQSVVASRQFSRLDMLANISGACVFGALTLLIPTSPKTRQAQVKCPVWNAQSQQPSADFPS